MGGKRAYELNIEIGHKSTPLPKKLANGYTHQWTVYVRGRNDAKIEHCISRVIFRLHDSFDNHIREITSPPYKVKETGYAGFEIPIEIYFKNKDKLNRLDFTLDLCLLTSKPNSNNITQKLTFKAPNRDFEKCLIKAGAQLLPEQPRKERSSSPPAKKHKSSSLIPSKDMGRQPTQSQLPQQNHNNHSHHHHHSSKSSSKLHSGNSHSQNNNNTNSSHQHRQSKHQTSTQSHRKLPSKPKSQPRDFIDVFGAPLVFNKHKLSSKDEHYPATTTASYSTPIASVPSQLTPAPTPTNTFTSTPTSSSNVTAPVAKVKSEPASAPSPSAVATNSPMPASNKSSSSSNGIINGKKNKIDSISDQHVNDLHKIQTKISSLSDSDRLQKIVDIVEDAGEWFNLTPNKFEFDLKRLDKKTLNRIERCLHITD